MKESVIYQEIEAQAFAEGFALGFEQGVRKVALNMLREGISIDLIVRVTDLTVEKVEQLQDNQQSNL